MMRTMVRTVLAVHLACVPMLATAASPEPLRVLDAAKDGPPNQIVRKHLLGALKPHFEARRATVKAIATPEQFAERQRYVRETLAKINGPFPEKTPLNPMVTKTLDRDGYDIENVIYQSRPGVYVTANFYRPKSASKEHPVPGVIMPCGHSANGKANDVYQSAAISMALNGMAVLIYDPIGQGERYQLLGTNGKPLVGSTTEHTLVAVTGWPVGMGTANYRIWDGIRSLDYLASRPEVDPAKLGCTGNSGGGTLTSYLMAFDDRIAAAAPSCYITTLERLFETIGPQDGEQNFPGQVALGLDHADFIAARAPKPTMICVGTRDYFDIDGAWTTFREAKALYGMLGHTERMDFIEFNDKHGFSKPRRQASMRFLRRWLVGKDDNPDEPAHTLSKEAELQCTKSGQVLTEFDDAVTVFQVSQRRAEQLANSRKAVGDGNAAVRRLTGVRDKVERPNATPRGEPRPWGQSKHTVAPLILQRESEPPIPALLFSPNGAPADAKRAVTIYVSSGALWPEAPGEIEAILAATKRVLVVSPRGWGETAPGTSASSKDPWFGGDIQLPLLSLHLNRSSLGQRTEDVLAAVSWVAQNKDFGVDAVELVGVGHAGPVALHAAALDPRISTVTVRRSISSWREVVNEPANKNQLQNIVPFALEVYDLPDLVNAIAPRKVTIEEPVDAAGLPH